MRAQSDHSNVVTREALEREEREKERGRPGNLGKCPGQTGSSGCRGDSQAGDCREAGQQAVGSTRACKEGLGLCICSGQDPYDGLALSSFHHAGGEGWAGIPSPPVLSGPLVALPAVLSAQSLPLS